MILYSSPDGGRDLLPSRFEMGTLGDWLTSHSHSKRCETKGGANSPRGRTYNGLRKDMEQQSRTQFYVPHYC